MRIIFKLSKLSWRQGKQWCHIFKKKSFNVRSEKMNCSFVKKNCVYKSQGIVKNLIAYKL